MAARDGGGGCRLAAAPSVVWRWLLLLTAATAAAAVPDAASPHVSDRLRCDPLPPSPPLAFVLHQHNVLARKYTHYFWAQHGFGGHDEVEAMWQTRRRYALATEAILASDADAVTLQEVEDAFFRPSHNPHAPALLLRYTVYAAHGEGGSPGAVVLIRTDGRLKVLSSHRIVPGGLKTGGKSKSAVCVPAAGADGRAVWIVSAHLSTREGPQQVAMLEEIAAIVNASLFDHASGEDGVLASEVEAEATTFAATASSSLPASAPASGSSSAELVLAGDFNCEPSCLIDLERRSPWLASLVHVALPPRVHTGLSYDLTVPKYIDHIYATAALTATPPRLTTERPPASPYGELIDPDMQLGRGGIDGPQPAEVLWASDHVWVEAAFFQPVAEVEAEAEAEAPTEAEAPVKAEAPAMAPVAGYANAVVGADLAGAAVNTMECSRDDARAAVESGSASRRAQGEAAHPAPHRQRRSVEELR